MAHEVKTQKSEMIFISENAHFGRAESDYSGARVEGIQATVVQIGQTGMQIDNHLGCDMVLCTTRRANSYCDGGTQRSMSP
jgi:hypothetical protein